jgi:iron complex transport system substrate-binding protein
MQRYYSVLIVSLLLLWNCKTEKDSPASTAVLRDSLTLEYAAGFKVYYHNNVKEVEVLQPFQGATSGYRYLLVPHNEEVPAHDADVKVIRIPLNTIACTSTTHIPLLDYLGETDKLTGFATTDFISSEKMRVRVDAGKVTELGIDKGLNLERLAVLKPSMLMGYAMSSDYGQFKKIEELGVPVVINAEYMEKHPLGRAEWIKFMALFFNKEKQADSAFQSIKKGYLETKALADKVTTHPTVLSGAVYGDAWFVPGGQSYVAKLFNDAGFQYLWRDDPSNGSLQLTLEGVYDKGRDADFWVGVGMYESLQALQAADIRYTRFKPFKLQTLYSSDGRKGAKGGSEILELGYLRPDIILKDLVKIAHPELLPEHTFYFHKKIQ